MIYPERPITGIPKVLHQLWIGDASKAPTKFMATWRDAHVPLGFEYILWNEAEVERRRRDNPRFSASLSSLEHRIAEMEEINGKADILRWIILEEYGGVFCDADSICVSPVDNELLMVKEGAFAGYENERVRGAGWSPRYPDIYSHKHALVALGCVGFPPQHPLVRAAVEWMRVNPVSVRAVGQRAWYSVGPGLITRLYYSEPDKYRDALHVFPSYYFLPMHYSGANYHGHGRVYAYQEWGSTKRSYGTMNEVELPRELREPFPNMWVSVLISSYDTKAKYVQECLESIRSQVGHFGMEIVWINDGSSALNTSLLRRMLERFEATTRFTRVVYLENEGNCGIGFTLNRGVMACSHDIIVKMDSDDVMFENRIMKQMMHMLENPDVMICGAQLKMFGEDWRSGNGQRTTHPTVSWSDYVVQCPKPSHWFVNHPTLCFRRSAALEAGNYSPSMRVMAEDFEFEMRMMKKHGVLYNLPDVVLHYRIHPDQVTRRNSSYWSDLRDKIVRHHTVETDGGTVVPFVFPDGDADAGSA